MLFAIPPKTYIIAAISTGILNAFVQAVVGSLSLKGAAGAPAGIARPP